MISLRSLNRGRLTLGLTFHLCWYYYYYYYFWRHYRPEHCVHVCAPFRRRGVQFRFGNDSSREYIGFFVVDPPIHAETISCVKYSNGGATQRVLASGFLISNRVNIVRIRVSGNQRRRWRLRWYIGQYNIIIYIYTYMRGPMTLI